MSEQNGAMHHIVQELRATKEPHDTERAAIIEQIRRARGVDIPFPHSDEEVESMWQFPIHGPNEMLIAEVMGTIASFPENVPLTRQRLAQAVPIGSSALKKILISAQARGLVFDGPAAPEDQGRPGMAPATIVPTPEFYDEVENTPAWNRSAQLRELMQRTGKSKGEALDYALQLSLLSLSGIVDATKKTA